MRAVADSHALVWFGQQSPRLSARARRTLAEAEASDGIVVSTATLIDLWYVTQTTKAMSEAQLRELRELVDQSKSIGWHAIDADNSDAYTSISRDVMRDPWDRLIV